MVVTGVALTVLSQSRHGVDESNNPKVDMKFVDEAVAPADPDVTPTPLIDADATAVSYTHLTLPTIYSV